MGSKSLVTFDCDGVLVDSEIISNHADSEAFTTLGLQIEAPATDNFDF